VRELVEEAGYQTASTMDFGVNTANTNSYELKRIFPLSTAQLILKILHRARRRLTR
jgi:hypothetical protein